MGYLILSRNAVQSMWGTLSIVMKYHTIFWESKLTADNTSIFISPKIITYSSPCAIYANLYSTIRGICRVRVNKTNGTTFTKGYANQTCHSIYSQNSSFHNLRWHFMPTSLECVQYVPTKVSFGHSRRLSSDPSQPMLVKNTGPLPVPKVELEVRYSENPVFCNKM